ncbi:hypothetical protein FA95DRAFT_1604088 [Auriscalpium vulgare]|uniref:Uncharacterized protein n=1 Tax=Auriscalpium vulgare TaxID=40419 RepID=A0ACB8S1M6_9AGAM|nr:hypothetical protein FA95DRAFT_1604088 [Auriscalpium vulgare]
MASPPADRVEHPDLVSLVLQSKKALQQGEALCSRANQLSNASAQHAFDVLALDAKIRWISEAVLEQLKASVTVAKSIEERRANVEKNTQAWDSARNQHTAALDNILESLGAQLVSPGFYETASDSSLFGSQSSDHEAQHKPEQALPSPSHSPALTIKNGHANGNVPLVKDTLHEEDRAKWKTLRDFVDERAIEDALETIDEERAAVDNTLASSTMYPVTLEESLVAIRNSLPPLEPVVNIEKILTNQDHISTTMATQLESLTSHFHQMEMALQDIEAGEEFAEEDLQDMVRDTDELPLIMSELEESCESMEKSHDELVAAKTTNEDYLRNHRTTLDDLDELGDIMGEMLQRQEEIETECAARLESLHDQLRAIDDVTVQYTSYKLAYHKLLVEMARRQQYKEAAEHIVRGMMAQLEAMAEEERHMREDFNAEHGAYLPSDICLYIENPPTRWEVAPLDGESVEVVPDVDHDLLVKAQDAIGREDGHPPGSESL